MPIIPMRPVNENDQASSFVLSIDAMWIEQLRAGTLLHLIRKRIPRQSSPNFVYLHAKSPVSAIVAKAGIQRLEEIPVSDALDLASELKMSCDSVKEYVGSSEKIGLLVFNCVTPAEKFGGIDVLRQHLDYHPPQSFSFVSDQASIIIDRICGF